MEYDFAIKYKREKENVVADALSRRTEKGNKSGKISCISRPTSCKTYLQEFNATRSLNCQLSNTSNLDLINIKLSCHTQHNFHQEKSYLTV